MVGAHYSVINFLLKAKLLAVKKVPIRSLWAIKSTACTKEFEAFSNFPLFGIHAAMDRIQNASFSNISILASLFEKLQSSSVNAGQNCIRFWLFAPFHMKTGHCERDLTM